MLISVSILAWALSPGALSSEPPPIGESSVDFTRDVRPLFAEHCLHCHGPDSSERKAGLRLDQIDSLRGHLINPGDSAKSLLFRRVSSSDAGAQMPPGDPLTEREIETLRRWIDQGADWTPHWSYVAPQKSPTPDTRHEAANWIDGYVLSRLESLGIDPSAPADRRTLIRRVTFDLIGLPPTEADVEDFVQDEDPRAYEKLVDRLLASKSYGERMAIHWLDLVRYADTVGYHGDQEHPISPYRDYVIWAFNENKPFDRFTLEQLAGDLLEDADLDTKIASGYNRLLQTTHEGGAQDGEYLAKYAADRVRNVSAVWLGSTYGCAECHDHKYDPITAKDFYQMEAFFADIKEKGFFDSPNTSPTKRPPEIEVLSILDRVKIQEAQSRLDALSEDSEVERRELQAEIEALQAAKRKTMITEAVEPRTTRVLPRGDWLDDSGEVVEPAIPAVFGRLETEGRATRLDLAMWLVSGDNPLTARVFVNRVWQLFFGLGISRVLDDFGARGEVPVHPELLDRLACEFVESGWDVKQLIRSIVTSNTYRQSSARREDLRERDPENRLLARQARRRLPAEMIRDNALSVSGLLVDRLGGPSCRPYQPEGYYMHLNFPKRKYEADDNEGQYRRGVYMHWQRQYLHPMLLAFDAPTREECTAGRSVSNTPLQALALLNDPSFVEAARCFAERILTEIEREDERIGRAFEKSLLRKPTKSEGQLLEQLLEDHRRYYREHPVAAKELVSVGLQQANAEIDVRELAAWTSVSRALFNLNEFITLD